MVNAGSSPARPPEELRYAAGPCDPHVCDITGKTLPITSSSAAYMVRLQSTLTDSEFVGPLF